MDALKPLVEERWTALGEVDDRTSPAEYPDMLLITREELADAMTAARAWPDLADLVFPRDPQARAPDPVLEALSMASKPWMLDPIFRELRRRGAPIPAKAEAEYAAALHFLVGLAIQHGVDWPKAVVSALRAYGQEPPPDHPSPSEAEAVEGASAAGATADASGARTPDGEA